jgi:hypothetical protein
MGEEKARMSSQLLKTQHYTVWLLRKRGSNWFRVHEGVVDMAEDNFYWRGKIYPLKSTNIITYTKGRLSIQRDLLMFDADKCEPLQIFDPSDDENLQQVMKDYVRSSAMVGQGTSEEALRNSESIATIRRQQKIIMILAVGLAVAMIACTFFGMYAFGLFRIPTSSGTGGGSTGPRMVLEIFRWMVR